MQPSQAREFGLFERGNGAEQANLLAVLQLGLEAYDVVERAESVVLAQLHHGEGTPPVFVRIPEPHRLHWAMGEGSPAALGHHLDRQTAFEIGRIPLPIFERRLL